MNVLLTGGAGFIGSHTAVELLAQKHSVVVADNLYNSSRSVIDRIEAISGVQVPFYEIDVTQGDALRKVFEEHEI
ncbi:MAG: SDR family NAD(P)-dependent oxidoreductase, partial [Pyramidobacter sp.]|nr:SDR family NAD(P)-dependent oxidoreductase [Pyramidobacter sp.]